MTLDQLSINQSATLHKIEDENLALQLLSMGFILGEKIEIERKAPLNDPIVIKSNNNCVSIRKVDAKKITVNTI